MSARQPTNQPTNQLKKMIVEPKWKKHSEYLGKIIYKRLPNTGSHGGNWMTDSTLFKSLAKAKAYIDFYHQQNIPA
jgi:hypothetical protein